MQYYNGVHFNQRFGTVTTYKMGNKIEMRANGRYYLND